MNPMQHIGSNSHLWRELIYGLPREGRAHGLPSEGRVCVSYLSVSLLSPWACIRIFFDCSCSVLSLCCKFMWFMNKYERMKEAAPVSYYLFVVLPQSCTWFHFKRPKQEFARDWYLHTSFVTHIICAQQSIGFIICTEFISTQHHSELAHIIQIQHHSECTHHSDSAPFRAWTTHIRTWDGIHI